MRALVPLLLLGLPVVGLAQQSAEIDEREVSPDSELARAAVAAGEILPLSALLPLLAAAVPGEMLDVELELDANGRIHEYEFEVLTPDGRLVEVDMDAATGAIVEIEDEDDD